MIGVGCAVGLGAQFQAAATLLGWPVDEDATVAVAEPAENGFVYALNAARTTASVPVSGMFTGTPGAIQARVVTDVGVQVVGWSTIEVAPEGGTFSGSISVPEQGMQALRAEVRANGATQGAVAQSGLWSVGLVFLFYGQSNMVLSSLGGSADIGLNKCYDATSPAFGGQDAGLAAFMSEMNDLADLPVLAVVGGQGGTGIDGLSDGDAPMIEMQAAIGLYAPTLHGIVWNQGEGDAITTFAASVYPPKLAALHATLVTETGQAVSGVPLVLSSLMSTSRDDGYSPDNVWADFKDMQRALDGNAITPNVHFAGGTDDMVRTDNFHSYGGSYALRNAREAYKMAEVLGYVSGDPTFEIVNVVAANPTSTTLTLSHGLGTDFSIVAVDHVDGAEVPTAAGPIIYGLAVSDDDWATSEAATGVRTDATTITLTHAALGGGERHARYLYGRQMDDLAGIVVDNSAYAFPLLWGNDLTAPDIIAPVYASIAGDGADDPVVLTFSEDVVAGDGTFTLWSVTDDAAVESFTPSTGLGDDGGTMSISGDTVTLIAGSDFDADEVVAALWTLGAVKDAAGNDLAANADDTVARFTVPSAGPANIFLRDPGFDDASAWTLPADFTVSGGKLTADSPAGYTNVYSNAPYDTITPGALYEMQADFTAFVIDTAGSFTVAIEEFDSGGGSLGTTVLATRNAISDDEPALVRGRFTSHADAATFRFVIYKQSGNALFDLSSLTLVAVDIADPNIHWTDPTFQDQIMWTDRAGYSFTPSGLVLSSPTAWQGVLQGGAIRFAIDAETDYIARLTVADFVSGGLFQIIVDPDVGSNASTNTTIDGNGVFEFPFTTPAGATAASFSIYTRAAGFDLKLTRLEVVPA